MQLLRDADCTYGNCELVMADEEPGFPTAAGGSLSVVASPKMADEFAWLGFDVDGHREQPFDGLRRRGHPRDRARASTASGSRTRALA